MEAGGVLYRLRIEDLARVKILENGESVGTRDFYCGPLDDDVVVRYVPEPSAPGAPEHHGKLVSVDFVQSR